MRLLVVGRLAQSSGIAPEVAEPCRPRSSAPALPPPKRSRLGEAAQQVASGHAFGVDLRYFTNLRDNPQVLRKPRVTLRYS